MGLSFTWVLRGSFSPAPQSMLRATAYPLGSNSMGGPIAEQQGFV
ncbi:hypothetical protein DB31_4449 [Hyalangium minutum]|uniref:Uncharacterized protein n=1 Tax=Hyalangium minutum TaxID=394096 RepID=A0A085W2U3_9BACT|nr:hypothetical protein DB31_4449 [Hyalangium minutum]